jgi:ankyrin repeat protein
MIARGCAHGSLASWLAAILVLAAPPIQAKTPLERAAGNGNLERVKKLLAEGANINAVDEDTTWEKTPLIAAAEAGHVDVVKYLLARGADTRKTTAAGGSALRLAVENGHAGVVEALLAAKADTEHDTDSYGRSPLVWAVLAAKHGNRNDHVRIIGLLARAGAKCRRTMTLPVSGKEMPIARYADEAGPAVSAAWREHCGGK